MAGPEQPREPPLGLYVHLPWCVRKCPYCDFNSHELRGALPAEAYLARLDRDLEEDALRVRGRRVRSVFFGGGTPSLFSAVRIGRLIDSIASRLELAAAAEVTLEANPGAVEHDDFRAYRDAGVNRISLGVQSFDDGLLGRLGRIHDGRAALDALGAVSAAGFASFNVDLMFGLPGQDVAGAVADVERALAAGPAHLSHYQLTLEPNTPFAHAPPKLPEDDACWEMERACGAVLRRAGYGRYEVSAWARPGFECVHNLNYWRYGDFIGVGAGAHSKLTDSAAGTVERWHRTRHPRAYLDTGRVEDRRRLTGADLVFEFFLNRLRLRELLRPRDFIAATGLPWSAAEDRVGEAVARGLLAAADEGYRVTKLGRRFLNDLQALFLP